MALIKCKECDKEVSRKAKNYPNCSAEIAAKRKRKPSWIIYAYNFNNNHN